MTSIKLVATLLALTLTTSGVSVPEPHSAPPEAATITPPAICGQGGSGAAGTSPGDLELPDHQAIISPAEQATRTVSHAGAALKIKPSALPLPVGIGITVLPPNKVPELDAGMVNVTGKKRAGYQFTPHPMQFTENIEVSLPYDPALLDEEFTPQDIYSYFYDELGACWRQLERVRVDETAHVVVSLTDHFTDMINATVSVPEHPDGISFNPNQIKDIQAADPSAGINLIAPPNANNKGENEISYPLEVPPGRLGMQPQLSVSYGSSSGNGWLGLGWNLSTSVITIDTRWGVPRYDGGLETETYVLNGEQLTPVTHRSAPQARATDKVFHTRVEGAFARIVRHGSSPDNYTWEVTDKTGTTRSYGTTPESVLTDAAGNVFMWYLRDVTDVNGNFMRYHYARVDDPGVDGGTEPGTNLFLQRITYTGLGGAEGKYSVTFLRDRDLAEPLRVDKMIDARGGFKKVTADLLRRVEIALEGDLIRRYEFEYTTGAFHKTLLRALKQFDADGAVFATHDFEYFDDIRDSAGEYQAFQQGSWSVPGDGLSKNELNLTPEQAGDASAISANTSFGGGGHLYVGVGTSASKSGSVGLKVGFSHSEDEGVLALIDVDGDSLPDKVFRDGGTIRYRKNLSGPGGGTEFSVQAEPLPLPGIAAESTNSLTLGIEGYVSAIAAQLDYVNSFTTASQYFSDVNGDGIMDLVNGSSVLFGRIGPDGVPVYGVSGDTPVPIDPGMVDPDGLFGDFTADRERMIDSFPLLDTVRRWVAPYTGTVRIEGTVKLADETADARAASQIADGVTAAIQLENTELWSEEIGPQDNTGHAPDGVDAVAVTQGDRLYFRLQSNFDGGLDQVDWDPVITYTGVPAIEDVNGLPAYEYRASSDFTLGGRTAQVKVPLTGTMHLSGDFEKLGTTSDDITVVIARNGVPVLEESLSGSATGTVPVDLDLEVLSGQILTWRVKTDSAIDLSQLAWVPRAYYTAADDVDRVTDPNGDPLIDFFPPYELDMYPVDGLSAPQSFFDVPADGMYLVDPELTFDFGGAGTLPTATVVFTVKRRGELLAERFFDIDNGVVTAPAAFNVTAAAGDDLFFDFSTLDIGLRGYLTGRSVTVDAAAVPNAFHSAAEQDAFPQPYRGWGAIGYNGNRDRANQPIVQTDLVVDDSYGDQLPDSVDPPAQRDDFAADPRIDPPTATPFLPSPRLGRWGAGEHNWVSADAANSSRMGVESINLPRPEDFGGGATAVPRLSRSDQISLTGSVAFGDSTGQVDFMDMNGDMFPDVVGAGAIQYTDPTGGLGATRGNLPDGAVRKSTNVSGNASAGSAARTIVTGRGYGAPPTHTSSNNSASSGNDMPPLGVGGSLGGHTSDGDFDLLDVNGDNLPDRIYADGRVALNLGYRFGAAEPWRNPAPLNEGSGENFGINIGFNTDFYGFAGGASYNEGSASTSAALIDVNGDGLADRVFAGSPIRVALNTGNGFEPAVPFHGSLSQLNNDQNAKLGGGVYFTIPICFVVVCIIINPGGDISTGASRAEAALRDVNGDGYLDHLTSSSDNELTVAENATGRTNLLRTVHRPLGARMDFDYVRDGNTYDQPASRWVLSRVSVHDGHAGDGQDVQLATYEYTAGVFDRLEREFLGYGTVVERQRDAGNTELVYRTVTREYRTDGHYTRGLLTRELTTDATGSAFLEIEHTYQLRDVGGGIADPKSITATVFPQLVRTDKRFFEGEAAPGKSTYTTVEYGELGNVVRTFDAGDAGADDDVEIHIGYPSDDPACQLTHIVGTPDTIQVYGGGTLMRHREADIDCASGDTTQVRAMLADGTAAVTDLEYFANGNLRAVIAPPNEIGQRYRLDYTYDPVVDTHVQTITDIFGYESSTSYDLRFGLVETTTDHNGQVIRNTFDAAGRMDTVTGPHEAPEGRTTIDFEYHPEATVPYAVTRHVDREAGGTVRTDTIDTITFIDGLKRVVQTKEDAALHTGPDTAPAASMVVSGCAVYDFAGRVVEHYYPISEPKGAANTSFNPAFDSVAPTRRTFDVLDRITRTDFPDSTATTVGYGFGPDRAGVTQFETVTTDANGQTTRVYEDVRTLKVAVKEFNPSGGQPVIWTSYGYDALQQVTSITDDQSNVTTMAYDNLGRQTVVDNPDGGQVDTVYDLAGNPIQKITAKLAEIGQAIEYDYEFNRLQAVRFPVFPANNVSYSYGPPGATDNSAGRITQVVDGAGILLREYGPLGEVVEETRTTPAQGSHIYTFVTEYEYDTWNRMLRMTYPDGEVLTYNYNSGGKVDAATGAKGEFSYEYLRRLDYDEFGERVLLDTGNGTRTQYSYNPIDRRLDNLNGRLANGYEFNDLNYSYDDVGNITSINNDTVAPDGPEVGMQVGGPSQQIFEYDDLYRLVHAEGSYQPRTPPHTDRYRLDLGYDSIHNLTSKTQVHELVSNGNVQTEGKLTYNYEYAYDGPQPHAPTTIGIYTLAYDANGNQISRNQQPKPRRQLIWDEENRLACSHENVQSHELPQTPESCDNAGGTPNRARYYYDDQGQRIVKDSSQFHIYPNQHYSTRGNQEYKHVYIGDTKLITKFVEPEHRIEDRQYYSHGDHLGSTGFVTNDQGGMSEHLMYMPGGETWVSEHPSQPVRHQFTGKEFDPETKLYYFGARYYDPRTQVWQSPDPALPGSVRDAKDLSAYLYGGANPLKMIDPDGRQAIDQEALGDEIMLPGNRYYQETYTEYRTVTETRSERGGGEFMAGTLVVGGITTQLDSPVPGPADIAGGVIIVGGALIAGALWLTTTTTVTQTRVEPITRTRTRERPLTYVTYTKTNPATGEVYVGRSAGYGTPQAIVAARDAGHHKTAQGFGPAVLDQFVHGTRPWVARHTDPAYQAIRGREQQMIDALGGSWAEVGRGSTMSGNAIRGVAKANPLGRVYHAAASAAFGQIAPYTGY